MSENIKLMIPGPTQLPPDVINAISQPMIYHRGDEFIGITLEVVDLLKQLFYTKDCDIFLIPASGRGAMEAAIVNLFSYGDKVLSITNGYFGEIFSKIAETFGINVITAQFEWEEMLDFSIIEDILTKNVEISGILYTHCETSGAIENDLITIGNLARKYNKLLIVDAVSSFGCMPIKVDEYGIDVVVTATQKGLMCPAGMSVVAVSPNAMKSIANSNLPKYYFDFKNMEKYIKKGQTPVSTPVPIVRALNASLKLMNKEGFENVFLRHEKLASYIRDEATLLGYVSYPDNLYIKRSNSLSAFLLPNQIDAKSLINHILIKYNTLFATGLGKTSSNVLRIGHMGWFFEEDAIDIIKVLRSTKRDYGF